MVGRIIPDNGQNNPDWIRFLENFKSAPVYSKRVNHFVQSIENVLTTEELGRELKEYFNYHHEKKKKTVHPVMLLQLLGAGFLYFFFFFFFFFLNLKYLLPSLHDDLTTWDTG